LKGQSSRRDAPLPTRDQESLSTLQAAQTDSRLMPFAYFIPFAETISGALILFGLFTRVGLTLSGLLLIGLTFGVVMLGQAPTVAHNLQYVLLNFVLLWFVDLNRYSVDGIIARKPSAGFTAAS